MLHKRERANRWAESLSVTLTGALLVILLLLAGCGGGGGSNPPQGNPVPTVTSISPSSVMVGASRFTLTVTGTGFISSSAVKWNGADRTTSFISSTQLSATIRTSD